MTNLEIEHILAVEARCDVRTARKALEHGARAIRKTEVRDRVAFAMRRIRDVVLQYSKEHYP